MSEPVSNCCHSPMIIGGDDEEGTHYYICTKCDEACDMAETQIVVCCKCNKRVIPNKSHKCEAIMSEPLSKVFQLERKEAQPAPHKFINTHEDYCEGYNDCLKDLDQLSPDVHKLAEILRTPISSEYNSIKDESILIAQEIINKMSEWIKR